MKFFWVLLVVTAGFGQGYKGTVLKLEWCQINCVAFSVFLKMTLCSHAELLLSTVKFQTTKWSVMDDNFKQKGLWYNWMYLELVQLTISIASGNSYPWPWVSAMISYVLTTKWRVMKILNKRGCSIIWCIICTYVF